MGIASANLTLIVSLTTGIIKKLLSKTRIKKKQHYKILVLAKSEPSRNKTLVCQALIDMEINHEEFITILNEKDKYEKMKEDIITIKSRDYFKKEGGKKIKTAEL